MNAVQFDRVSRHYGEVKAVDDISFQIPAGAERFRQDHLPADDRRLRIPERGGDPAVRRALLHRAPLRPQPQYRVSGLRPVSQHGCVRQHRLRPDAQGRRQGGALPQGGRDAGDGTLARRRQPQAGPALRRPAPAHRHRPGTDQPAAHPAAGRAAGGPRPQAARADAARTQSLAAPARHHLHLRHPRSAGGALHERPHLHLQSGQDRADRRAGYYL